MSSTHYCFTPHSAGRLARLSLALIVPIILIALALLSQSGALHHAPPAAKAAAAPALAGVPAKAGIADSAAAPDFPAAVALLARPAARMQSGGGTGIGDSLPITLPSPGQVWAGTYSKGTWLYHPSTNSWEPRVQGMGDVQIVDLAINPFDDKVLLAVTPNGVYRTSNNGQRWERVEMPLTQVNWCCIRWDPITPGKVIAGGPDLSLSGQPLDRSPLVAGSMDGGKHWHFIASPPIEESPWSLPTGAMWGSGSHWYIGTPGSTNVWDSEYISQIHWRSANRGIAWVPAQKEEHLPGPTSGKQPWTGRVEAPAYAY